jgi:hypothetical protein
MAEPEQGTPIEDLEVDGEDADSVRGGNVQRRRQAEIARLKKAGWLEEQCTTKGDLFVNPKTHEKKLVPYIH